MIIDGIWDFAWSSTDTNTPDYNDFVTLPDCFDNMQQHFRERGFAFYKKTICAGGNLRLKIGSFGLHATIYWDGKDFRGYIPFKGNLVDTKKKIILNQDEPSTARYILDQILPDIPKLYGPDQDEDLMDDFEEIYDLIKPNLDWMIEDFEERLTIV